MVWIFIVIIHWVLMIKLLEVFFMMLCCLQESWIFILNVFRNVKCFCFFLYELVYIVMMRSYYYVCEGYIFLQETMEWFNILGLPGVYVILILKNM